MTKPQLTRWIPITEQLPEQNTEVLFCCLIDGEFTRVQMGAYWGKKTDGTAIVMDIGDDSDWSPCSHWMPIPEHPAATADPATPTEDHSECSQSASDKAATEWASAWRVIVRALKEMGVTDVDHNAAAIIARLSHSGMVVVFSENVKD